MVKSVFFNQFLTLGAFSATRGTENNYIHYLNQLKNPPAIDILQVAGQTVEIEAETYNEFRWDGKTDIIRIYVTR